MKQFLHKLLNLLKLTTLKNLEYQTTDLKKQLLKLYYPIGHYYSPYPSLDKLHQQNDTTTPLNDLLMGINLNIDVQVKTLMELGTFYNEIKWQENKETKHNYYYNNLYFSYSDAIFLHCMCRAFSPKKIIEVGSGYSSAAMFDINNYFFNGSIDLTFIEPYPEERLYQLIENRDKVIVDFVQNIPLEKFKTLNENDILFIDTSHVSKYQSDVNHIIFNILPQLKSGVIIHIHDIFYPFDYPTEWLKQGRAWNEAYLLRAFLQYNNDFEILLFPSFLEKVQKEWLQNSMPKTLKNHEFINYGEGEILMNTAGQSIYLRKK